MLPHQLSCPIGGLLLSVLMLKDADPNHYPVPGVECVVSHESRQFTDDGHKILLGHLRHPLRVGNTLVSAHCNVHSFSPPPKRRRGRRVPPNQLINVPSVKGYKGWRNFRESPKGEVRRIPIPRTSVNKGKKRKGAEESPPPSPNDLLLDDLVGTHHVVVFMLEDVAVEDVLLCPHHPWR